MLTLYKSKYRVPVTFFIVPRPLRRKTGGYKNDLRLSVHAPVRVSHFGLRVITWKRIENLRTSNQFETLYKHLLGQYL